MVSGMLDRQRPAVMSTHQIVPLLREHGLPGLKGSVRADLLYDAQSRSGQEHYRASAVHRDCVPVRRQLRHGRQI